MATADQQSTTRKVILLILVTAALRVLLAAGVGLSIDESYTVAISHRLALSYFDHPPLHVWMVGQWARLLGSQTPVALRLPFIALFAVSTWLLYRLTVMAFGERPGWYAVLLFNCAPFFSVAVASCVLPDGPLVCSALLAALCIGHALSGKSVLGWFALAGVATGLALLSKYMAFFLPLALLGFLLTSAPHRRLLGTPAPWLAALIAGVLFIPVLLWNAQHRWVSFVFQAGRAVPASRSLSGLGTDLGGQLAYLFPWIAIALAWALWRAWRRGPGDMFGWLFAWLASVPILFFTVLGLRTAILPHWPMLGWVFAFPVLGREIARLERVRRPLLQAGLLGTPVLLLATVGLMASQTQSGWLDRYLPALARSDPTIDLLDWRAALPELAARGLAPGMPLVTESWMDAGKLSYALRGRYPVLCIGPDARGFLQLHPLQRFAGSNALIIVDARRHDWQLRATPYFRRIEPLPDIVALRAGRAALVLKVALGIHLLQASGAIDP